MPSEFKQAQNSNNTKHLQNTITVGRRVVEEGVETEGENSNQVDDVDRRQNKGPLFDGHNTTDYQFEGEPCIADTFDVKEDRMGHATGLTHCPPVGVSAVDRTSDVVDDGHSKLWQCSKAESQNRNDDEEERDSSNNLKDEER